MQEQCITTWGVNLLNTILLFTLSAGDHVLAHTQTANLGCTPHSHRDVDKLYAETYQLLLHASMLSQCMVCDSAASHDTDLAA